MENLTFWIILIGLISNLTVGLTAYIRDSKRLKIFNVALLILIPLFVIYHQCKTNEIICDIKKKTVSFIQEENEGYRLKTLSEITEHLRRRGYDESYYSKARIELLKENVLKEIEHHFNSPIKEYKCFIYTTSLK